MLNTSVLFPICEEDDPLSVANSLASVSSQGVEVLAWCISSYKIERLPESCRGRIVRYESDDFGKMVREMFSRTSESKLIHFLKAGTYMLPGFYDSSAIMLESSRLDYCFVHALVLESGKLSSISSPIPDSDVNESQVVVRRWVLGELGVESVLGTLGRVVEEYRGVEIDSTLCIEVK